MSSRYEMIADQRAIRLCDAAGYRPKEPDCKEIPRRHVALPLCADLELCCEVVRRYCRASLALARDVTRLNRELGEYLHIWLADPPVQRKGYEKRLNQVVGEYGCGPVRWDICMENTYDFCRRYAGGMQYVLCGVTKTAKAWRRQRRPGDERETYHPLSAGIELLRPGGILTCLLPREWLRVGHATHFKEFCQKNRAELHVHLLNEQETVCIYLNTPGADRIRFYRHEYSAPPEQLWEHPLSYYKETCRWEFQTFSDTIREILRQPCSGKIRLQPAMRLNDDVLREDVEPQLLLPAIDAQSGQTDHLFFPYDRTQVSCTRYSREEMEERFPLGYSYLLNLEFDSPFANPYGKHIRGADTINEDKCAVSAYSLNWSGLAVTASPAGTAVYGDGYIVQAPLSVKELTDLLHSRLWVEYIEHAGYECYRGTYLSAEAIHRFLSYCLEHPSKVY